MVVRKWLVCFLAAVLLSVGFVTVSPQVASAAGTYYVDAASGNDTTGNGSSGSPWKTISKAASVATAGDTVKIRSGTYRETVKPANSGTSSSPITYEPDTNAIVTVSGADLITGSWSVHSGNIYKKSATLQMGDFLDSIYVDGVANYLSRSPNTPVGNLYDPYMYTVEYPGTNNGVLVDTANLTQPNGTWDNAAVFIRDSYEWNFSGALGTTYSTGALNLKTWQSAYNLVLSSYDNTLKLLNPSGAVIGSYNVTVQPNTTYNLKVTASGNQFNVYWNNGASPVISVADYAQVEGSFGLGVESNSSSTATTVQFTNVNATITSQNPNQPTGRMAANFASNIKGWRHGEEPGYWKADGTTLTAYTQPSTSTGNTWYYSNTTAKDFTYSADVKLTSNSGGKIYLQFRKEEPPRNVIDINYNDYYMNPNSLGLGSPEYYIMGALAALDYPGEWFYHRASGTLYLRTTSSDNPANHTVEAKARNLAFDLTGKSNIVVKGVKLFAATIDMTDGSNNVIDGINAKYLSEYNKAVSYHTGICLCGNNNTVKNSELQYSSGEIVTINGTNNKLINNKIHDGTYGPITFNSAVNILGSGHLISHNEVYNAGRSLIGGEFFASVIQYNDFHHANYFATDTGLLYTAHNGLGNSEIHHNYWHDSGYRYNGANGIRGDWVAGIYLDEHTTDALIYDNVTWNIPWYGVIANHLGNNLLVYNNTTYNDSVVSMNFYNPDIEAYGIRVANNISLDGFNTSSSAYGAQFYNNMTSGTPNYVNAAAADFRLQAGSGAIDIGTPIRGITTGYTGAAPDAGAYEYGGASWTAGVNLTNPPSPLPTYQLVDTDYKNLVVNGRLDLNRIELPSMDALYGWTKTNSQTAQPAFDISGGKVSSHFHYETGASLGTGADGIEQTITGLQPNTTYELRGFLRVNSSGQSVRLGVKNHGGTDTYQASSSVTWEEKKFTFTTGAANTSATIYGYKPTTGDYAFVDDVSVIATTAVSGDTQAPSAPTNLAVTSVTDSTASLSWTASTDNVGVAGYKVYRNGAEVGTASGTSYTDSGLAASTTYTFTVKAYDAASNLSGASNSAQATTSAGSGSSGYTENFESTAIGSMPSGWTVNAAGGAASVQQVADGANTTNRALKLTQSSYGAAGVTASKTFSSSTGTVAIQTRMKADQTNALNHLNLMNNTGTIIAQFGFMQSGKFGYVDPTLGWVDTTVSYTANQWYEVQITVDLTAGTYNVSIGGTTVLTNKPLVNTATNVSQIQFTTNMWYTGTASYDNIQVGAPAASSIYSENFESTAIGSMPSGWTVNAAGGAASVQQVADGANTTNRALKLTQSNYGVADASAIKSFTASTGTVAIQMRMKADQTNALTHLNLTNNSGTVFVQFGFNQSGKFAYVDPTLGWVDTTVSYTANQWYDVQITVNLTAGTYNVSIGGTTVLTNKSFVNTAANVAQIQFMTNMWYNGSVSYDNIQVGAGATPPPSIYSENFEGTAISSMPSGWTVNAAGGAASVQQVADGANTTNRALKLTQTSYGTAEVSASKTFTTTTGTATISTRMKADQTNALTHYSLTNSAGTTIVQIGFTQNGKFGYVDPTLGWVDTTTAYSANQWYDVQIAVNLTAGTYNVTIGGSTVLTNKPLLNTATNVAQILIGTNMWYTGSASYDNIQVTQ